MRSLSEIPYALLARLAQGAVMLGAGILVVWRVPPAEQGFFWTFLTLGALQQTGELGLTYALLQTVNYHAARGEVGRLAAIWRFFRRMATLVLPVAALATYGVGFWLFYSAGAAVAWQGAWAGYVAASAVAQFLFLRVAYLEGVVSASASWRFQALLEALSGVVLLGGLASGAGLWSLALYAFARCAAMLFWPPVRPPAPAPGAAYGFAQWRTEVWPYQWKLAVNALTGILVFRTMLPIVLAEHGPIEAGRFGLSLALMNAWLSVTTSWPLSQTARFGHAIGGADLPALRRAFHPTLFRSTTLAAAGAVAALACAAGLERVLPAFAAAYAGLGATAFLMAAAVMHHAIFCIAVLLRAERRDPLLPLSVGGALLTLVVVTVVAGLGSLATLAAAYAACTAAGLLLVAFAFRARLRQVLAWP